MSEPETEITIEGITITARSVRIGDDSYQVAHIQSVHLIETSNWWDAPFWVNCLQVPVLVSLFMVFDIDTRLQGIFWSVISLPLYISLMVRFAKTKTITVAIIVSGRRRILASFLAYKKRWVPNLETQRAKADTLRNAIQRVL